MSTVLEIILLTPKGMNLVRSNLDHPQIVWKKNEAHQTSSYAFQRIDILLSDRLTNMKISGSASRSIFLKIFDTVIQKFHVVSIPKSYKVGLLKKATNLLSTWIVVETIIANMKPDTTTTYGEYMDYLVSHTKKLEENNIDNSGRKVNCCLDKLYGFIYPK